MTYSFTDFQKIKDVRLEIIFDHYLKNQTYPASILQKAMGYSISNGGKRLRPLLVYAVGLTFNVCLESLDVAASAIELIHGYSLIHDDLPAMDNADTRRNKPTCHKMFNEAMAILAGDALQTLAFQILTKHPAPLTAEQRLQMIEVLTTASGAQGMVSGQTLDMMNIKDKSSLLQMYALKTGALIVCSVKLGLIAAQQSLNSPLVKFAELIGLAFQLQDDLLDYEEYAKQSGKPVGLDNNNKKITYPSFSGIAQTKMDIEKLYAQALQLITPYPQATLLYELTEYMRQRKK